MARSIGWWPHWMKRIDAVWPASWPGSGDGAASHYSTKSRGSVARPYGVAAQKSGKVSYGKWLGKWDVCDERALDARWSKKTSRSSERSERPGRRCDCGRSGHRDQV